jgi:tetratricopeptide (TPR) repeat protein
MPPRFFRTGLLIVCAVFFAAAIAQPSLFSQSEGAPGAVSGAPNPGTLLVFPFENSSRVASLDWLGEGLAELTTERLQDRGVSLLSRQDRLAALEKIGLPDSARFSHATIVKIATEADADGVVFGRFIYGGKTLTLEARVLRLSPPWLSPPFTQSGPLENLLGSHARLSWQILCALAQKNCLQPGANTDESSFAAPPPSLRADALQNFVRGIIALDDDSRLRALREAARLEPAWDRPAFELGQLYFTRHNCEAALPWYSHVPPGRPDGPEAGFNTGICHLLRNDAARAEAAFSGLLERSRSAGPKDRLPEMPEVRNNLGVAHLRAGKSADAAAEFERAAALDEEEPDYWVNLGIAKLAAKQPAAAVPPLERALKIDSEDKGARTLLISTLESLGRTADAAALVSESAESSAGAIQPAPRDHVAQARLSMKFDRTLLRPGGNAPAGQPSRGINSQKHEGDGSR